MEQGCNTSWIALLRPRYGEQSEPAWLCNSQTRPVSSRGPVLSQTTGCGSEMVKALSLTFTNAPATPPVSRPRALSRRDSSTVTSRLRELGFV